jgi:hypothetical protein
MPSVIAVCVALLGAGFDVALDKLGSAWGELQG